MSTVSYKVHYEVKGIGREKKQFSLAYIRDQYQTEAVLAATSAALGGDLGLRKWYVGDFHADGTNVASQMPSEYGDDVEWFGWFDIETVDHGVTFE
jgi:hypothetical protein